MSAVPPSAEVLEAGWRLAVRTAIAASVLLGALGGALYRFAAADVRLLVAASVIVGLGLGMRLPPAARRSRATGTLAAR